MKLQHINFIILTGLIALVLYKFYFAPRDYFEEISVERLNVVGKNGNKYIVLSSPEKQALATMNGELLTPEETERPVPGLLFFNSDGDEIGGLIFDIDSTSSYQLLTFDQRKSDQIMVLRKDENLVDGKWTKQYGLQISERSDKSIFRTLDELREIRAIKDTLEMQNRLKTFYQDPENTAPTRMFVGRLHNENVGMFLLDKNYNIKFSIYVNPEGRPVMQYTDSLGGRIDMLQGISKQI